jgi:hypothetical protein
MDPEEDPFETPLEREYNRLLGEMAQQKEECTTRIDELQRKIKSHVERAGDQNGGKTPPSGDSGGEILRPEGNVTHTNGGHRSGHHKEFTPVVHHVDVHSESGSNSSFIRSFNISSNGTDTSSSGTNLPSSGVGNSTSFSSGAGNSTASLLNDDPVLPGGGCTPCPELPDVGDPCGRDSYSVLATPEAILVGAAAAVLVLVAAAVVAIIVRYLPNITSGLLIITIIVLVWYCSSMYPEAARRLGARILGALRNVATSIVDRVLRRNHPEVKSSCVIRANDVRRNRISVRCVKNIKIEKGLGSKGCI